MAATAAAAAPVAAASLSKSALLLDTKGVEENAFLQSPQNSPSLQKIGTFQVTLNLRQKKLRTF